MDKETSDEKLLKLIESTSPIKRVQKVGVKPKTKGLKPLLSRFNFRFLEFNLYNLNKALYSIAALLTLVFVYTIISGVRMVNADLIFPASEGGSFISNLMTQEGNRFLTQQEYIGEVSSRKMFLPLEQKASAREDSGPDISELIKDLKLVGIIWSSNPEVMIENIKEKRTYLLKKDETFGSLPYKIKNILRNMVVLEITTAEGAKDYELK
jgi:type II secretory pathway component PulC